MQESECLFCLHVWDRSNPQKMQPLSSYPILKSPARVTNGDLNSWFGLKATVAVTKVLGRSAIWVVFVTRLFTIYGLGLFYI